MTLDAFRDRLAGLLRDARDGGLSDARLLDELDMTVELLRDDEAEDPGVNGRDLLDA